MFFQRRNAARTAAEDRELQVLLADLSQRQQEIVDRGRSENYLYVVFFTAIGAIIAGMAAFFSLHLTTYPVLLPTLVSVGFLVLLCLPVNLIHLGSVTELRRIYIQQQLEPRLRVLGGSTAQLDPQHPRGVFSFEAFDRLQHRGAFNFVIGMRSAFMSLPAAVLFVTWIVLRVQLWATVEWWQWVVEAVVLVAGVVIVASIIGAFARMWGLIAEARAID